MLFTHNTIFNLGIKYEISMSSPSSSPASVCTRTRRKSHLSGPCENVISLTVLHVTHSSSYKILSGRPACTRGSVAGKGERESKKSCTNR
jgi:hypothetical protein